MTTESNNKPATAGEIYRVKDEKIADRSRWTLHFLSPGVMLLLLAAAIFFAEIFVMFVLERFGPIHGGWEAVIDSCALLLILAPFYFLLYRPFWNERKRAEQEIVYLTRQLIKAGEEERKGLARDLHDECGQVLASLQFGIETLKHSMPVKTPDVESQCTRLSGMLTQLVDHLRVVTGRLRPAMLDSVGLVGAVHWMCQGFSARWEIPIHFSMFGQEPPLDPETEITLFRICQEGLTNIAKHAQASEGYIQLDFQDGHIVLVIGDNGRGFDPLHQRNRNSHRKRGIGLLGMRERATSLGGTFVLDTVPQLGTTLRIDLPYKGSNR